MRVIGLTGGIGSGKSTVSLFLAELGAVVIDADKVGHEAFKPGTESWKEIIAAFGREVLTPDGEIDRRRLGEIVFGKPELLSRLNRVMHPRVYDMVKAQLEEYRQRGVKAVVLEAPLLIEVNTKGASLIKLVDEVWVTVASEATVVRRLEGRSDLSRQQALARIKSQLSSKERIKRADVVINNNGDLDDLKARVGRLWQRLNARRP
ncbi:MAG TPA: dephospho-CoA kinase [Dehalococcoidia bacterium]|nr:dephospho-CoA kinase [Dehalococcoidia bacterium]